MRRKLLAVGLLVVILAIIARSPRRPTDESLLPTLVILPTAAPISGPTDIPFTAEFGLTMDIEARPMYAQGEVVLRACPSRDCASVGTLPDGAQLLVDGVINGEAVSERNAIWYRAQFVDVTVYVYSEIVTDAPTAAAPISAPAAYVCPGSCDAAVSMGLSPEQAAACGLDADSDGVACYGD